MQRPQDAHGSSSVISTQASVNGQSLLDLLTPVESCHIARGQQQTRHHMNKLYVITWSALKLSEAEV